MIHDSSMLLVRLTILSVAFVGGFAIMTIELLGGRILSPYFGSSVYVWGSIITVFMLSLSIGYLCGGKLSTRKPDFRIYASFFFAAPVLLMPVILFAEPIMEAVFQSIEDPRYGSLLASTILYLLPTAVLGMISPYSIRLLVSNQDHSGHIAGQLYFVSTLGSALGTLATSFYFVLWFDVNQILWGVFAALIMAGIVILAINQLQISAPLVGSGTKTK